MLMSTRIEMEIGSPSSTSRAWLQMEMKAPTRLATLSPSRPALAASLPQTNNNNNNIKLKITASSGTIMSPAA